MEIQENKVLYYSDDTTKKIYASLYRYGLKKDDIRNSDKTFKDLSHKQSEMKMKYKAVLKEKYSLKNEQDNLQSELKQTEYLIKCSICAENNHYCYYSEPKIVEEKIEEDELSDFFDNSEYEEKGGSVDNLIDLAKVRSNQIDYENTIKSIDELKFME